MLGLHSWDFFSSGLWLEKQDPFKIMGNRNCLHGCGSQSLPPFLSTFCPSFRKAEIRCRCAVLLIFINVVGMPSSSAGKWVLTPETKSLVDSPYSKILIIFQEIMQRSFQLSIYYILRGFDQVTLVND